MFPQFKKVNNESGVVLFIVLMTSIIIMILSLSILTQSLNEINYAQQQIDQITASQWSKGVFWNAYSTGTVPSTTPTINLNGRAYSVSITSTTLNSTASRWVSNIGYDSF